MLKFIFIIGNCFSELIELLMVLTADIV